MSRRAADDRTLDLFVVPEAESAPAGMDYRAAAAAWALWWVLGAGHA